MKPYYNMDSGFILYNGDCVEVMNNLDKGMVDMVFADHRISYRAVGQYVATAMRKPFIKASGMKLKA